ncbi:uncharacterized protein LOC110720719 [Chenopodium quinoa]|uniref:uncharacterized protein LOC110720719 n=1 Tax=Chenopodium quinoa TaxID=63459 RepID=UPI000B798A9F|nr:uncharacterized protein LOC110720719 [Chenopodium quinoa]
MKKKFVPEDYVQDLYIKMQTFKQGTSSVESSITEFERSDMLCDLDERQEHKVARFIARLNEDIAEKVEIQPYWNYDDVCKVSIRFEKQLKGKKGSYTKGGSKTFEKPDSSKFNASNSSTSKQDKPKFEPNKKLEGEDKRKCFKCRSYGHISSTCPSKRVMTAHEWEQEQVLRENAGNYEEDKEQENDAEEEEHVSEVEPETHGKSLVLRRALHSQTVPMENNQREKNFLTRCKVKERLCDMIIDSGSCTNVVSTTLIDKLKHPTTEHPQPYKLHWLSNTSDVEVTKQALISFSIGKFKDQVLCDVCPMDACHIFLGRPWQFDRFVKYDGRTNVYVVKKGEKDKPIALKSLISNLPKITSNSQGLLMINEKEFDKAVAQEGCFYVLVSKEIKEEIKVQTPSVLEPILREFDDVFLDELPPGLPPIRGIEHKIDFIPGAPLPNKAAYRSNLEETKQMQRQIEELMVRSYVRESMSPCVVPMGVGACA